MAIFCSKMAIMKISASFPLQDGRPRTAMQMERSMTSHCTNLNTKQEIIFELGYYVYKMFLGFLAFLILFLHFLSGIIQWPSVNRRHRAIVKKA